MAKTIIFCADGTWNGPEDATGASVIDSPDIHGELESASVTNVVRLYSSLAGHPTPDTVRLNDEQEKVLTNADGSVAQIAKYLHGVGDSRNLAIKLVGGIFGAGIIARVVRGYTFISRNYRPGDAIHIVGFSRGAYTARALAGMISRIGLLNPTTYDPDDKAAAYGLGIGAWCKSHSVALESHAIGGLADLFQHALLYIENWLGKSVSAAHLLPKVPIKSVAVWDTVGALGIPAYLGGQRYDLFRFVDTALSETVEFGFHAMAIDELRADFGVTRWLPRQNVMERWFIGAHADVGGGYPVEASGLSDNTLAWLAQRLDSVGIKFAAPPVYVPAVNKYLQAIHTPWANVPFKDLLHTPRAVGANDDVDPTVRRRIDEDSSYRPLALEAWRQANLPPA